jgi:hypothetical protein
MEKFFERLLFKRPILRDFAFISFLIFAGIVYLLALDDLLKSGSQIDNFVDLILSAIIASLFVYLAILPFLFLRRFLGKRRVNQSLEIKKVVKSSISDKPEIELPKDAILTRDENNPTKVSLSRLNKLAIGIGIAALISTIGIFFVNSNSSEPTYEPQATSSLPDFTWIPDGFNRSVYDDIAYKWMTSNQVNSSDKCYGDYCWGIYIVTRDGCSNGLYAEFTYENRQGVQLGYSNDSVGSVSEGTTAQLMFNIFNSNVHTGKISEISCY